MSTPKLDGLYMMIVAHKKQQKEQIATAVRKKHLAHTSFNYIQNCWCFFVEFDDTIFTDEEIEHIVGAVVTDINGETTHKDRKLVVDECSPKREKPGYPQVKMKSFCIKACGLYD